MPSELAAFLPAAVSSAVPRQPFYIVSLLISSADDSLTALSSEYFSHAVIALTTVRTDPRQRCDNDPSTYGA